MKGGTSSYSYVRNTNSEIDSVGLAPITFKGSVSPYQTRYNPGFPNRPDPKYSIDTHTFTDGVPTKNGGIRNSREFWQQWAKQNPETLSKSNVYKIEELGISPTIDKQWIQYFPEHAAYKNDVLIHHHVDFGRYGIAVPGETHPGSGGPWHAQCLS